MGRKNGLHPKKDRGRSKPFFRGSGSVVRAYHATFGIPFRREGVSKAVEGKADVDDAELRQQRTDGRVFVLVASTLFPSPFVLCPTTIARPNPHLDRQRRRPC